MVRLGSLRTLEVLINVACRDAMTSRMPDKRPYWYCKRRKMQPFYNILRIIWR